MAAAPLTGQSASASGLARDLDAAVRYAASENEMVVISITDHADGVRAYEMKSALDEPVWLQAAGVRPDPSDPRRVDQLTMTARVGRFGNASRENKLLASIRERLAVIAQDPFSDYPHPSPSGGG